MHSYITLQMIQIEVFTVNGFQENTYLLFDDSGEAILIDPGFYEQHEVVDLDEYIADNGLTLTKIVNTHSHIDHVLGVDYVKQKYKVPFLIHPEDEQTLRMNKIVADMYGMPKYREPEVDGFFKEGEKIDFGNSSLDIVFAPGHAPGHVMFISHEQKFVIGGDVIFQTSIGRTDLPGGDHETLLNSIRKQVFTLPEDYVIHCGHGPSTNVGFEKEHNPFLN